DGAVVLLGGTGRFDSPSGHAVRRYGCERESYAWWEEGAAAHPNAPQVPAAADDQDGAHVRALLQPAPQLRDFVQRSQRPHRKAFGAPRGTVVVEKKEPSLRRNTALQLQEARSEERRVGKECRSRWLR